MTLSVIIVAAGKGLRMGAELPKQFLSLSSRPILMHTIDKFYDALPEVEIILALGEDFVEFWSKLCYEYNFKVPHKVVVGGVSRHETVRNSLSMISIDSDYVLIHDGVRPFVSAELIHRVVTSVQSYGAVVPAVDVVDSLRRVFLPEQSEVVDRNGLKAVQTPQAFRKELLIESYRNASGVDFTDDASVVENAGFKVVVVEGERSNLKITTRDDINFGNFLMKIVEN